MSHLVLVAGGGLNATLADALFVFDHFQVDISFEDEEVAIVVGVSRLNNLNGSGRGYVGSGLCWVGVA